MPAHPASVRLRERPAGDDRFLDAADSAPPPDTALLREERDVVLWSAFSGISERCQGLLRLHFSEPPIAYSDISAILDMPVGPIGPTRQRCLARLRERITAAGPDAVALLRDRGTPPSPRVRPRRAGWRPSRRKTDDDLTGSDGLRLLSDDDLLAELRRVAPDIDPVPESLLDSARALFELRSLDVELLALLSDSLVDADPATTRGLESPVRSRSPAWTARWRWGCPCRPRVTVGT